MSTWRLIDYFDVWFYEDEGYWVNNQCVDTEGIAIAEDASDEDIFHYLRDILGFLDSEVKFEELNFEGDDFFIEITTEIDGWTYPICRLEREVS